MPVGARVAPAFVALLWSIVVFAAQPRRTDLTYVRQRFTILAIEDARAPTDGELALLLTGAQALDPELQRILVRALGRLERRALAGRITPFLRSRFPAVRAEAANALAQAARGADMGSMPAQAFAAPIALALKAERSEEVKAVMARSLARLPYRNAFEVREAETAILEVLKPVDHIPPAEAIVDAAIALESLIRLHRPLQPPSRMTIQALKAG